ncbi:YqxA family protein [Thermaerobacillus caldiproteolyticus]|uniref:DUF3679 domain-containing protein n=1 Tax=Thermaerobacillus caldiproteolyticus TaxID=247480 RepID=A0A7V9Z3U7_9BACL|nr:YqxA family protein [Anoxybacillus caldiproteolyticus]MBA2873542.1 hypothetical protein [Anoxybacillus caldiproteolyticus]QPA30131.1 YqxA family protein [Anoxybacillus caldiproteolyticus]
MVKFTIQFFAAVALLFFGVLLGMQQASEGLQKMKGYNDPSLPTVFHFSEGGQGELEASIMGNKVKVETFDEKKEKLNHIKTLNVFSELGKRLADAVHSSIEQFLSLVNQLLGK